MWFFLSLPALPDLGGEWQRLEMHESASARFRSMHGGPGK